MRILFLCRFIKTIAIVSAINSNTIWSHNPQANSAIIHFISSQIMFYAALEIHSYMEKDNTCSQCLENYISSSWFSVFCFRFSVFGFCFVFCFSFFLFLVTHILKLIFKCSEEHLPRSRVYKSSKTWCKC